MGRAYRYQRRMAHIEIALAERGQNGAGTATVVGEEEKAPAKKAAPKKRTKITAKPKAKGKAKKKATAKK
jgi:large subunit ribosomal protein L22